ncbi:MAG TPA: NUDIX hydrolase [Cytophagales bacterium]|nr:NUDIX hydrolase [Cytophagales bacterium]HAA18081.1 NUDIX hydrolase [Cytophagales bacterium]HAP62474.1 NUDIX hydrolase [Cytophagales bacterium]
MEEWDVYDRHRVKTGKVVPRGSALRPDEFHLVVHVCFINAQNQMLIQQRQPFKEGWPNRWDVTVGGSAQAGEDSPLAAERELHEEIGYSVDFSQYRPIFTIHFTNGFDDYYLVNAEVDLVQLRLQPSEVKQVKWADKEEIMGLIRRQEFIPYHRSVIELIFDMAQGRGAYLS